MTWMSLKNRTVKQKNSLLVLILWLIKWSFLFLLSVLWDCWLGVTESIQLMKIQLQQLQWGFQEASSAPLLETCWVCADDS